MLYILLVLALIYAALKFYNVRDEFKRRDAENREKDQEEDVEESAGVIDVILDDDEPEVIDVTEVETVVEEDASSKAETDE